MKTTENLGLIEYHSWQALAGEADCNSVASCVSHASDGAV